LTWGLKAQGMLGLANHGDEDLVGPRGVAGQYEGCAVLILHSFGTSCLPPSASLHVRAIWDAPVEQPRLIRVVDSIGRVRLQLLPDLRNARSRRLRVHRPVLTPQRHVAEVLAPSPVLNKTGGPLEARGAQVRCNPPRPRL